MTFIMFLFNIGHSDSKTIHELISTKNITLRSHSTTKKEGANLNFSYNESGLGEI